MKTLKSREFVQIKNQAKVIAQSIKEKAKKVAALEKAQEELQAVEKDIEACDGFIFNKYGVHIEDVVERVVTKVTNAEGKESYKTDFKPTSIVKWNEETKVYEIEEPVDLEQESTAEETATAVDEDATAPEVQQNPSEGFDPTNWGE